MKIIACLALVFLGVNASPLESDIPAVEPEYLSKLLDEGKYEEFSYLLGIPDPSLAKERDTEGRAELSRHEAMMHKNLKGGDMLPKLGSLEEERQAIRFDKYGGSKWPNGEIPYVINNDANRNNFTSSQRRTIENGIKRWNDQLEGCLKLVPRNGHRDYVFVFSGDGCWSYIGRTGRQQGMSLQHNGCLSQGTILHEFQHAAGFHHEQNRQDRDNKIEMLWHNIPDEWKDQYEKTNSDDWTDVRQYDYYSIMHYPVPAPGTNRKAFNVRERGIDENRIGNGDDFTDEDRRKIRAHYGCKN